MQRNINLRKLTLFSHFISKINAKMFKYMRMTIHCLIFFLGALADFLPLVLSFSIKVFLLINKDIHILCSLINILTCKIESRNSMEGLYPLYGSIITCAFC